VTAVGPAYAGLGAAVQVSLGPSGTPSEAGGLGAAAVAPTATTGPVTVTVAGAPVADWDRADCRPGPSCTVPPGTTSVDIRLDLTAVTGAASIPISVVSTADGATAAHADITVAALARPAGLEYFAVERGAVAMAANTVVACVPEPGTTCDANNNEEQNLGRVSVGPGAVDSSSAELHLPAGATVRWTLLQWGGDPRDAPDPGRLGDVELTTPDGNTVAVHAARVRTASGDAAYTARADVTSIVRALAQPAGRYTVADVQTGEGAGQFGGWSLIVAYRQPDAPRSVIAVFDDPSAPSGVLTRVDHAADVVYSLTGLAASQQPADVQLGVVAYDGDLGITGDTVKVGAVAAGDPENFFDSSIAVGEAARDPSFPNQYGFDAHLDTVAKAVRPADAGPTVTVHIGEGNDGIYLGAVTLVVAL
jgi:hypothetical protein